MIKSQFTLKQLEAFAFVVDTGTFRAAAAALGTTQPNISSRIAALETTLGVTLLHRDAGSVRLTAKGEDLLQKTRTILWAGEALLEEADRRDLVEEQLRLGVTELVACTWLQRFLRKVKLAYPNLRVSLEVDLSNRIAERLSDGLLDLAFQTGPFKSAVSSTLPLGREDYIWVASPSLAAELGAGPDMARLFAYPVLTHAKHTQAGLALHAVAEARGYDQAQIVHSSALSACVPMACESFGAALLPKALVRTELGDQRLKLLPCDWTPDPLSFFARFQTERVPRFVVQAAQLAVETVSAQPD